MDAQQSQFLMTYLTGLWEGEFPQTCRVLAAVPDAKRDYKPDEKSRTGWELTVHLATGDIWFLEAVLQGRFDYNPESEKQALAKYPSVAAIASMYKEEFPKALAKVRAMSGADLQKAVDFFGMMKQPNVTYLGFGNNHSMHHRGQLAAYIRAMGGKVPAIYGGSADEPMRT